MHYFIDTQAAASMATQSPSVKPEWNDEQQAAVAVLRDLVQINSENGNEEPVARYLQALLKTNGIESTLIPYSDGRASLVAEIQNGTGKTLVLSGHMDVVSAGDPQNWTHPPFSAHIDEYGVMWGRGTSDMKSGLAALVLAFIAAHRDRRFSGTLRLLATVGEEVGEHGSRQLTDLGYMDDADGLLIGEPCNVGIMYAHKGSLNYKVTATGLAAHSSTPELGHNAIHHLHAAIHHIHHQLAAKTAAVENPVLGKTFHNITLIQGGLQVNSIPDHAEFEANARTIPEFDNQAVMNEVQNIIDRLNTQEGYTLKAVVTADQPPVQSQPDSALIQAIQQAAARKPTLGVHALFTAMGQVLQQDLSSLAEQFGTDLRPIAASGTTDAAQFTRRNRQVDLAVYGPGMPMLNHKIDERLPLAQYLDFIDVYRDIIAGYLNAADSNTAA